MGPINIYTFSQLGKHGALGNQLWEIAGTIGLANLRGGIPMLPRWDYEDYFNYRIRYYTYDFVPDYAEDLYPQYLQELWMFEDIESIIRCLFRPAPALLPELPVIKKNSTAVHVRRANNLTLLDRHPVCPLEYYEAALDQMPKDNIWVFSDDLEWCKQQSIFKDAHFGWGPPQGINIFDLTCPTPLTNKEAVLDLFAMASCDHHVISNSSFSWWGAWIADGERVIYPGEQWYGPALSHIDTSVMFPDDWISIRY